MSATSDSSTDFHLEPMPFAPARSESALTGEGGIWLDGDVLACTCPDCNAPMSIRLWLMTADCFRCGSSLELTEEQEQEAMRLLREQEESRRVESDAAAAAISPTMVRRPRQRAEPQITQAPPAAPGTASRAASVSVDQPIGQPAPEAEPRRRRVAASAAHRSGARGRIRKLYEKGGFVVWWSELGRDMPAWFISAVIHAVALLLLALWLDNPLSKAPSITLSTSVSAEDTLGDQGDIDESDPEAVEFESPGALPLENSLEDMGVIEEPLEPEHVDPTAIIPPSDPAGNVPDRALRERIPMDLNARTGRMFAGRNPDTRAQTVLAEGGTTQTEAAVARALKWLERHQNEDGSWSLHAFHKAPGAKGKKPPDVGSINSNMAGTALSLLPFLGAGQTHLEGEYQDTVRRGLEWVATNQLENGDCRGDGNQGRMYAHGQASIALCEAFAMTQDEDLREYAQMALNFIVKAQHHEGGWRYSPGERADTSVVGWQIMALRSGDSCHLHVPAKTYDLTAMYLDRAKADKLGGKYCYQPRGRMNEAMTAEGLLCRMYLGWPRDHPGIQEGVKYLIENHLPNAKKQNMYYWYYATQVMHHYGGKSWETWNAKMRDVLVNTQEKAGDHAGSWPAKGGQHDQRAGRLYMTSLAACILEVYYRHMPLYATQIDGEVSSESDAGKGKEVGGNLHELHTRPGEKELHTRGRD